MRRVAERSGRRRRRGDRLYRDVYAESSVQAAVRVLAASDTRRLPDLLRVALTAAEEIQQPETALVEPVVPTPRVS